MIAAPWRFSCWQSPYPVDSWGCVALLPTPTSTRHVEWSPKTCDGHTLRNPGSWETKRRWLKECPPGSWLLAPQPAALLHLGSRLALLLGGAHLQGSEAQGLGTPSSHRQAGTPTPSPGWRKPGRA